MWIEKRKAGHRKEGDTRWEARNVSVQINTGPTSCPLRAMCRCFHVPFRRRPLPALRVMRRWPPLPLPSSVLVAIKTSVLEVRLHPSSVRGKVKLISSCGDGQPSSPLMELLVNIRFRCITPYPPNSEYELELRIGDVVYVHKKRDDGWYKGTLHRTGKTGLFPASFVESC